LFNQKVSAFLIAGNFYHHIGQLELDVGVFVDCIKCVLGGFYLWRVFRVFDHERMPADN